MAKGGDVLVKRLPSSRVSAMSAANENGPVHSDGAVALSGAGDGTRTRGYQLGKLGPYHLATPASATHYNLSSFISSGILGNPRELNDTVERLLQPMPVRRRASSRLFTLT